MGLTVPFQPSCKFPKSTVSLISTTVKQLDFAINVTPVAFVALDEQKT